MCSRNRIHIYSKSCNQLAVPKLLNNISSFEVINTTIQLCCSPPACDSLFNYILSVGRTPAHPQFYQSRKSFAPVSKTSPFTIVQIYNKLKHHPPHRSDYLYLLGQPTLVNSSAVVWIRGCIAPLSRKMVFENNTP